MRRLEKDESLCIGCHQCEEACSKAFYKVSDPMKSCIRITDKEDGSHHIAVCTQCGKCSEVCNTGVITEDARGVYRLNKKDSVRRMLWYSVMIIWSRPNVRRADCA